MSVEEPKRLKPRTDTARELFLKSGNLCAFPNCSRLMMNEHGDFVGEICHIEGVKGERFNPDMTNEERRHFSNLMLMCHDHHVETDDEQKYPVERMQEIKAQHEQRFSNPARMILDQLVDWTTLDEPVGVKNLRRVNDVLQWGLVDEELRENVKDLNAYIDVFSKVPLEVRRFVASLGQRIVRLKESSAVGTGMFSSSLLASDVESAFGLGPMDLRRLIAQLDTYGIGGLDEIETGVGPQEAIEISATREGLHVWTEVAEFCTGTNTPIERFYEDLDFSAFDE